MKNNNLFVIYVTLLIVVSCAEPKQEVIPVCELPPGETLPSEPEPPPEQDDYDLITICHKPKKDSRQTLTLTKKSAEKHIRHGDKLGECNQ